MSSETYEAVIGLEVHTHLRTESKLFCSCSVRYGDPPNHHTCPVCLALPGALPVLNGKAIELAVRAALAANCSVQEHSVFARKNYFYPDLPKGYQISQYEEPYSSGGWIEIELPRQNGEAQTRRVNLTRIHMEEDAGKSMHDESGAAGDSLVDLNRAGVPLLEIVSEPELRSAAEAGAYLRTLRQLLRYVGVSDADMEKGHFRCDANVSLRPQGSSELGTRTELKNLNSFRFVEEAISAEIERQTEILDDGGSVVQATMLYDRASRKTRVMRVKEHAHDYRYFPDPDLVPLELDPAWIEEIRGSLPELPAEKRIRFQSQYELSEYDARQLTNNRALAEFFEAAVAAHGVAKSVANWISRDVLKVLKERELEIDADAVRITPQALAALLRLVDEDRLTPAHARELIPELVDSGADPEALMRERGLEAVSDAGELDAAVEAVIAENPEFAERVRAGEEKVLNALMGQVMKRTQGKANPRTVRELLAQKLGG